MIEPKRYYSADQNIRFRMTTLEEEQDLFRKARAGDKSAREFLIRNHLLWGLLQGQAMARASGTLPPDEIISAVNAAIMEAFDRFDEGKGFRFTTYLRPFIKGQIALLWRSKFSGGCPDPSLGGHLNYGRPAGAILKHGEETDTGTWEDYRAFRDGDYADPEFEQIDLQSFNREKLAEALARLSDAERTLLFEVYQNEKSLSDVARERGKSRQGIQAQHAAIVQKLRKWLTAAGVEEVV